MIDTKNHQDASFRLRREGLVCLLLVMATLAVYWQVQHFDFVNFDDIDYVYENYHIQNGLTQESISWAFTTTHAANWHPLTWLSHMLDCKLFGLNPGRHHLTNLLFHIANTLLLFVVFRKMTGGLWQSAFVAALFALHPCHVGSVAWISERKDLLSTFFWMLTMWGYIRYVEHPKVTRYLLMVLFFSLGLMSKPMLVTLPFVLLLLDYWPLCRFRFGPSDSVDKSQPRAMVLRLFWEKVPLLALVAMSSVATFYAQKHGKLVVSLDVIPFKARVTNALVSYVKYIGKMIYPAKLAAIYPHPGMLPWWQITGAFLLLLVISFAAIRFIKQKPYVAVGWLWFLGTLVPVIGLVQVGNQAMADRYTYVPFIGLFIVIAWGVFELTSRWQHSKKILAGFATVILVALMAVTWKQTGYWQNSITLFEHNLKVTAEHSVLHNSLGFALENMGRTEEAIEHYSQALRINPNFEHAHNNLGNALDKLGRTEEAIDYYLQALRINPNFEHTHNNLGNALVKMGRAEEAIEHYLQALQIKPDFVDAHNNLGNTLLRQGKTVEAVRHFNEALRLNPNFAKAHNNLGIASASAGKIEDAIAHFHKALQIDPKNVEARLNLNNILETLEKIDREISTVQTELGFAPKDPGLHYSLGNLYKAKGQLDAAENYYQKAIALQPEFPEAFYELAKLYISRDEYQKALFQYEKILTFMPDNPAVHYNIACIYAKQKKPQESVAWLKKAVSSGFNDWEHIKTDSDLDNIRGSSEFELFLKSH